MLADEPIDFTVTRLPFFLRPEHLGRFRQRLPKLAYDALQDFEKKHLRILETGCMVVTGDSFSFIVVR